MARCRVEGLNDLIDCLEDMIDNIDNAVEEALFEGGNILRDNVKSEIRSVANRTDTKGKKYSTGELAASVVPTTPAKNGYGNFVAVRPVGMDSKGVRNGEKWGYLEHGVPGGQDAHHFIDSALSKSEAKCAEIAQEILNKHVKL